MTCNTLHRDEKTQAKTGKSCEIPWVTHRILRIESSAEYSRCTCVDEMIDLHALLMNNFEHSVFSIEPTAAVHRCVRKIIEFASGIDVLSDTGCCV